MTSGTFAFNEDVVFVNRDILFYLAGEPSCPVFLAIFKASVVTIESEEIFQRTVNVVIVAFRTERVIWRNYYGLVLLGISKSCFGVPRDVITGTSALFASDGASI